MTVHGESSNEHYQRRKESAIRAAAAVFAEKGYHGASTSDIASQMGIKQGSLYYYFKSKEEALSEVCLYGIEDYLRHLEQIVANDEPFEASLMATLTAHLNCYRERNEALRVHNAERLYLPKEKRGELKRMGSRYRQLLERLLESGVQSGVLRDSLDCHFAAQAVIGICNSWGELIVRNKADDVYDTIRKTYDLLLYGFRERREQTR